MDDNAFSVLNEYINNSSLPYQKAACAVVTCLAQNQGPYQQSAKNILDSIDETFLKNIRSIDDYMNDAFSMLNHSVDTIYKKPEEVSLSIRGEDTQLVTTALNKLQ